MSQEVTASKPAPALDSPRLRTPYRTKAFEIYNSAARSVLSRNTIFHSRNAILNLCLLMALPVTAEITNTTTTITTTTTTQTEEEGIASSGYRISLGLVEISALATLIGATNAESLALGLAAAAGLPWAPISTFGVVHVIKVSLAAVVSDRLREALAMRSDNVDSALGMNLEIDSSKAEHHNINTGGPCAIMLPFTHWEAREVAFESKETGALALAALKREETRRPQSVHALEKSTAGIFSNLPATGPGEKLDIYQFSQDKGPEGVYNTRNDRVALVTSLFKLVEVYALWKAGGETIWWVTAIAWAHGFVSAAILQGFDLSRDTSKMGQSDIITGELPTPLLPGGARKVLLGLPRNVRRHWMWRVIWGTGLLVNCVSILATFLTLGSQSIRIVYIWVGFQIFWLLMRTFVYNFLAVGHSRRSIMVSLTWETAPIPLRRRLINLMMGLAKQQITAHPRGAFAYQEDLVNATEIVALYKKAGYKLLDALPLKDFSNKQTTNCSIIGIVGDTVLRSSNWFMGVSVLSPDLYDCVLVFVEISGSFFAVPSVRVLSGLPLGDVENRISSFEPRGTSNDGHQISWEYWVPANDDILGPCWLEARGMKITGQKTGVLSQKELQSKLQAGGLNISLVQIAEVERVAAESRKASQALMQYLQDVELE